MTNNEFTLDVSIIIVNYNTKQLLADCLNSIYEQTKEISFEVIVSDNGSKDGSIEMLKTDFPQVILIENNANLGFGAANNRGLAIAKGKYIFYLNSDTILLNNAVKCFFDYWENSPEKDSIGALGANLLNINNETIHSGGSFPDYKSDISGLIHNIYGFTKQFIFHSLFRKSLPEYQNTKSERIIGSVDYITGADLFLENNDSAYFDEDFFMYCEETYLQYNLSVKNKKRILIDCVKIIHLEGQSAEKITTDIVHNEASFAAIQSKLSRIIYFKKTGIASIQILVLKILTTLLWLNPFLFKNTKKYIKYIYHPEKNKKLFY